MDFTVEQIKKIADFLGLHYIEDSVGNIELNKELEDVLNEYAANRDDFLNGKIELYSPNEVMKIIGNFTLSTFSPTLQKLLPKLKPKTYYKVFRYDKNEVHAFNNLYYRSVDIDDLIKERTPDGFRNILNSLKIYKMLSEYVPDSIVYINRANYYVLKEAFDKLDMNKLKEFTDEHGHRAVTVFVSYTFKNAYPAFVARKLLNLKKVAFNKLLKNEKRILKIVDEDNLLIDKDSIEALISKWKNIKENYISLGELYSENEDEIIKCTSKNNPFYKFCSAIEDRNLFDKYGYIKAEDVFLPRYGNAGFIPKEYKSNAMEDVLSILRNRQLNLTDSTSVSKFKFHYENSCNKNAPKTLERFSTFAINVLSTTESAKSKPFIDLLDIFSSLDKEIHKCDDEDLEEIMSFLDGKVSKRYFCEFITDLQSKITMKAKDKYSYILYKNCDTKKEIIPYTTEQYLRFGFLVLAEDHKWHETYWEKAVSARRYSSVWLYALMHYISAWRKEDIRNIPNPYLPESPKKIIDLIKSKKLPKEYAEQSTFELVSYIKTFNKKPSKTAKHNAPELVLEIPESIKDLLGTLLLLVEAQRQTSPRTKSKTLLAANCHTKKEQYRFFGEEFNEIFKGDYFANLRANKNYEMTVATYGEENLAGSGYILASIARSHKLAQNKPLAETTQIYLEYYYKLDDSETLMRELFERGVCSFAPYLLAKAIKGKGEIQQISPKETTLLIKDSIGLNAHQTETFVGIFDKTIEKVVSDVNSIIKYFNNNANNPRQEIKNMVSNISHNTACGKTDNTNCMILAQGLKCPYPQREHCIGCGHEIYFKSCFNELGNYLHSLKSFAYSSQTKASKYKYAKLVTDVVVPVIKEIQLALKEIYNEDNTAFFKELESLLK